MPNYQIVGPFLRERPTTSTTHRQFAWCYLWIDSAGRVAAVEWRN